MPRRLATALASVLALTLASGCTSSSGGASASPSSDAGTSAESSVAQTSPAASPTGTVTRSARPSPAPSEPSATGASHTPTRTSATGDVTVPLPAVSQTIKPPVKGATSASLGPGVRIRLVDSAPVTIKGRGVGEGSGPGMAYTLRLSNGSRSAIDLASLVVAAQGKGGAPIADTQAPPTSPFTGSLQPGASKRATYAFFVPRSQRDQVRLVISYSPLRTSVVIVPGS